ncbi:MAG: hypothetical protein Fur0042_02110 [Cyanophyceae cyanobacterium]
MNVTTTTAVTALLIGCQTAALTALVGTDSSRNALALGGAGTITSGQTVAAAPQGDRGGPDRTVSAGRR